MNIKSIQSKISLLLSLLPDLLLGREFLGGFNKV